MTLENGQSLTSKQEIWIWTADDIQLVKGQIIDFDQITDNLEKIADEGQEFIVVGVELSNVRVQNKETGFETYFSSDEIGNKFSIETGEPTL